MAFLINEAEKLTKGSVHEDDIHRPRCFGVNYSEVNNKMDETRRVLTSLVAPP